MVKRPNYAQERAERRRRQEARRDERVAAKAARRGKSDSASAQAPESRAADPRSAPPGGDAGAPMLADPQAMMRLGEALKFVCGIDHPATLAVLRAAANVDRNDIERARVLFQQLAPESQRAALTIAAATPSARR